jgi:hypothetical protein
MMVSGHLNRDTPRETMMHRILSDADHLCPDTGYDCAHYGEIVASAVVFVEEYIHPVGDLARVVCEFAHFSSVLVEHFFAYMCC